MGIFHVSLIIIIGYDRSSGDDFPSRRLETVLSWEKGRARKPEVVEMVGSMQVEAYESVCSILISKTLSLCLLSCWMKRSQHTVNRVIIPPDKEHVLAI